MTSERSLAYGRVMKALADMGPSKLHQSEQESIREAADTLLFAVGYEGDGEALAALERMGELFEVLVESERWLFESADRLMRAIEDCGPALVPELVEGELLAA